MSNPVVYFDIAIAGRPVGRIEMTLRADVCPRTVLLVLIKNDRQLRRLLIEILSLSGRKFSRSMHRRKEYSSEKALVQRLDISSSDSSVYASRRGLHSRKRDWRRIYLRPKIRRRELYS